MFWKIIVGILTALLAVTVLTIDYRMILDMKKQLNQKDEKPQETEDNSHEKMLAEQWNNLMNYSIGGDENNG